MTAVLYDEGVSTATEARLMVAPATKQTPKPPHRSPIGGGDPMVDAAARLLSIPLRELYAVLWRVGLIEVTA
jgi:hypothetical protein